MEDSRTQKSKSISLIAPSTEITSPVKKRTSDKSNETSNSEAEHYDTISLTVFGKLGVGKSKLIERFKNNSTF
jgi:GTPase SAR1 family protein